MIQLTCIIIKLIAISGKGTLINVIKRINGENLANKRDETKQ